MTAYYNENDALKAEVLREAIKAGAIAAGHVDERSIADVQPADLVGFTQCHFFAGGGFWSLALRYAGWPDDRPVWTGSCPCQSFSMAGKQFGFDDPRHLWPHWYRLIDACRPPVVFGEQVAAAIGRSFVEEEDMRELLDREAVLRVLYELQREPNNQVQVLRPKGKPDNQEKELDEDERIAHGMADEASGSRAGERSEVSGEEEGDSVRSRPGGYSAQDRRGPLRTDRDSVLPDGTALVERSVAGSDKPRRRVHDWECTCSPLFPECDGQCVGRWANSGDIAGDCGTEKEAEQRLSELLGIGTDEELGFSWLDAVQLDMEASHYRFRCSVLGACSVGAPHIRQRLYFVANAGYAQRQPRRHELESWSEGEAQRKQTAIDDQRCGGVGVVGNATSERCGETGSDRRRSHSWDREPSESGFLAESDGSGHLPSTLGGIYCGEEVSGARDGELERCRDNGSLGDSNSPGPTRYRSNGGELGLLAQDSRTGNMADALRERRQQNPRSSLGNEHSDGREGWNRSESHRHNLTSGYGPDRRPSPLNGFWRDADWIGCRDGKFRPVEPGAFPLAYGSPASVGRLRLYGDGIVVQVAQTFIEAYLETET